MYKYEIIFSTKNIEDLLKKIINWANEDSKIIISIKYENESHYVHDRVCPEYCYYAYIIYK